MIKIKLVYQAIRVQIVRLTHRWTSIITLMAKMMIMYSIRSWNILSIRTIVYLKIRSFVDFDFREQKMKKMILMKKNKIRELLQELEKDGKVSRKKSIRCCHRV